MSAQNRSNMFKTVEKNNIIKGEKADSVEWSESSD